MSWGVEEAVTQNLNILVPIHLLLNKRCNRPVSKEDIFLSPWNMVGWQTQKGQSTFGYDTYSNPHTSHRKKRKPTLWCISHGHKNASPHSGILHMDSKTPSHTLIYYTRTKKTPAHTMIYVTQTQIRQPTLRYTSHGLKNASPYSDILHTDKKNTSPPNDIRHRDSKTPAHILIFYTWTKKSQPTQWYTSEGPKNASPRTVIRHKDLKTPAHTFTCHTDLRMPAHTLSYIILT